MNRLHEQCWWFQYSIQNQKTTQSLYVLRFALYQSIPPEQVIHQAQRRLDPLSTVQISVIL